VAVAVVVFGVGVLVGEGGSVTGFKVSPNDECQRDWDCTNPSKPVCKTDSSPNKCVACLNDGHCLSNTNWGSETCYYNSCELCRNNNDCKIDYNCDINEGVEWGKCVKSVCGDGIVNGYEQCDDGNTVNGDGCSSNCINEIFDEPDDGGYIGFGIGYDMGGEPIFKTKCLEVFGNAKCSADKLDMVCPGNLEPYGIEEINKSTIEWNDLNPEQWVNSIIKFGCYETFELEVVDESEMPAKYLEGFDFGYGKGYPEGYDDGYNGRENRLDYRCSATGNSDYDDGCKDGTNYAYNMGYEYGELSKGWEQEEVGLNPVTGNVVSDQGESFLGIEYEFSGTNEPLIIPAPCPGNLKVESPREGIDECWTDNDCIERTYTIFGRSFNRRYVPGEEADPMEYKCVIEETRSSRLSGCFELGMCYDGTLDNKKKINKRVTRKKICVPGWQKKDTVIHETNNPKGDVCSKIEKDIYVPCENKKYDIFEKLGGGEDVAITEKDFQSWNSIDNFDNSKGSGDKWDIYKSIYRIQLDTSIPDLSSQKSSEAAIKHIKEYTDFNIPHVIELYGLRYLFGIKLFNPISINGHAVIALSVSETIKENSNIPEYSILYLDPNGPLISQSNCKLKYINPPNVETKIFYNCKRENDKYCATFLCTSPDYLPGNWATISFDPRETKGLEYSINHRVRYDPVYWLVNNYLIFPRNFLGLQNKKLEGVCEGWSHFFNNLAIFGYFAGECSPTCKVSISEYTLANAPGEMDCIMPGRDHGTCRNGECVEN